MKDSILLMECSGRERFFCFISNLRTAITITYDAFKSMIANSVDFDSSGTF